MKHLSIGERFLLRWLLAGAILATVCAVVGLVAGTPPPGLSLVPDRGGLWLIQGGIIGILLGVGMGAGGRQWHTSSWRG